MSITVKHLANCFGSLTAKRFLTAVTANFSWNVFYQDKPAIDMENFADLFHVTTGRTANGTFESHVLLTE